MSQNSKKKRNDTKPNFGTFMLPPYSSLNPQEFPYGGTSNMIGSQHPSCPIVGASINRPPNTFDHYPGMVSSFQPYQYYGDPGFNASSHSQGISMVKKDIRTPADSQECIDSTENIPTYQSATTSPNATTTNSNNTLNIDIPMVGNTNSPAMENTVISTANTCVNDRAVIEQKAEQFESQKHLQISNLSEKSEKLIKSTNQCDEGGCEEYCCGVCMELVPTLCKVYRHMKSHGCGGSFYFNQNTKTAYPMFDSVCTGTQTESDFLLEDHGLENDKKGRSKTKKEVSKGSTSRRGRGRPVGSKKGKKVHVVTPKATEKSELIDNDSFEKSEADEDSVLSKEADTDEMNWDYDNTDVCVKVEKSELEAKSDQTDNFSAEDEDSMMVDGNETDGYDVDDFTEITSKSKTKKKKGRVKGENGGNKKRNKKAYSKNYEHEDGKFKCKVCDKLYDTYARFAAHFKRSHEDVASSAKYAGEIPMECFWCKETFPKQSMCLTHMGKCKENVRLQCQICKERFLTIQELKTHLESHPNTEMSCEKCPKTFKSALLFHNHALRHVNVKKMQCEYCGKDVNVGKTFQNHQRLCRGERDLPCPDCKRMFNNVHDLRLHMAVHSDLRPYVCDVCGFTGRLPNLRRFHLFLNLYLF